MGVEIFLDALAYAAPVAYMPKAVVPVSVVDIPLLAGLPIKKPEFAPAVKAQAPNPVP